MQRRRATRFFESAQRGKLPWPIPERPARRDICDSTSARYSIVAGLEAWDKNDTRAVAVFRCERHVSGRAFPELILLQRVPLQGLTRADAEGIFTRLAKFLESWAQSAERALEATPGRSRERVSKVRLQPFSNRRNGRANSRRRGDVGLESASGDAGVARKGLRGKHAKQ
jgi:hypothetical protein